MTSLLTTIKHPSSCYLKPRRNPALPPSLHNRHPHSFPLNGASTGSVAGKSSPPENTIRYLSAPLPLSHSFCIPTIGKPSIWTAFKFTGATTAVSLGYSFPALVALKLGSQGGGLSSRERFLSWLMLCLAIITSIVGVTSNIYSLQTDSE